MLQLSVVSVLLVSVWRVAGQAAGQQCCCTPISETCSTDGGVPGEKSPDYDFTDFINERIVNRPNTNQPLNTCPAGLQTCCYSAGIDLSVFGRTCLTPEQAQGTWVQACNDNVTPGGKECGTRAGYAPATGRTNGQSSPGEFPWTCLILNQNNDFIGSCAIIPQDFNNNNGRGTRKVITAAHKLAKVKPTDVLKIRAGEYDASGQNAPETVPHQEYTVTKVVQHPQFNPKRLNNNLAILTVNRNIDLTSPNINTACLPSCDNQFDFVFKNGTGSRCWVAGWGKDELTGKFQVVQRKVDLPLVNSAACNVAIKGALNAKKQGVGDKFELSSSEICAGAEVGKDACTGDGGSPLVCQSNAGRWTVVGLVTWGVGCADNIPGMYARISYFRDWINAN